MSSVHLRRLAKCDKKSDRLMSVTRDEINASKTTISFFTSMIDSLSSSEL